VRARGHIYIYIYHCALRRRALRGTPTTGHGSAAPRGERRWTMQSGRVGTMPHIRPSSGSTGKRAIRSMRIDQYLFVMRLGTHV
jgi:hypothetical protein